MECSRRAPSCRSSTLQCRRVGTSWWKRSGTSICTSLSWLSKCPRSRLRPVDLAGAGFLADPLVEVPTIVSYSSLHGLVAQNFDIPVPRGRVPGPQGFLPGQSYSLTAEQIFPRLGGGGGLQGLHRGQNSTAFSEQIDEFPDPGTHIQRFLKQQQHTTTHNNTQQHTTTHNNTQQHTITHNNTTTTHNNTQQHTTTNNTQQHTTTHNNTQQQQ